MASSGDPSSSSNAVPITAKANGKASSASRVVDLTSSSFVSGDRSFDAQASGRPATAGLLGRPAIAGPPGLTLPPMYGPSYSPRVKTREAVPVGHIIHFQGPERGRGRQRESDVDSSAKRSKSEPRAGNAQQQPQATIETPMIIDQVMSYPNSPSSPDSFIPVSPPAESIPSGITQGQKQTLHSDGSISQVSTVVAHLGFNEVPLQQQMLQLQQTIM